MFFSVLSECNYSMIESNDNLLKFEPELIKIQRIIGVKAM